MLTLGAVWGLVSRRTWLMVGCVDCYALVFRLLIWLNAPSWLINLPQVLLHALVPGEVRYVAFRATCLRDRFREAREAVRKGGQS